MTEAWMRAWDSAWAAAPWVGAMMTALWVWSVVRRDASIVDPWWSVGFLLVTVVSVVRGGVTGPLLLLTGCVALWAVRLGLHLAIRAWGAPEDPRYAAFRVRFGAARYWWVSFFQVFVLQGLLLLAIAAPLHMAASTPVSWSAWHGVGAALFAVGFAIESVAVAQLQAFRNRPESRGTVMSTGLWARSRHPNYFGEAVLWWGLGCWALPIAGGWLALGGPALLTFLLLRVSGVSLLDAHLRATRPGYAEYIARTPGFVPRLRG